MKKLTAPFTAEAARELKIGDQVLLSGVIYTARDAAHKRIVELIERGEPLPFDLNNATIYFVGPTPPPPGYAMGAAGPTSSYRMDSFSPVLIRRGLTGMIGKGRRDDTVKKAMMECGAVYLAATGGAGALLSACVKSAEVIAFPELGAEAVRKLRVENMPLVVAMDTTGDDLYEQGRKQYLVRVSGENP